jgi:prophage tail gpP-like protein
MDRLETCVDALRVLARSNDPDRVVLIEIYIDAYLTTETVRVWQGNWLTEDQITVTATVHGWERPSGGLWYRDQIVSVTSPMLIMKGQPLIAKSVTFTQDDKTCTRTTLELCNANALGGLPPATQVQD